MKYIPQGPPFEMIDQLISVRDNETVSVYQIKKDSLFLENNIFLEAGLIENMAQTAAAGTGYQAAQEKKEPPVGFIGQVKNLKIDALPIVGDQLHTKMITRHQVMNAFVVEGQINVGEKRIARAEFKIFLQ